MNKYNLFQGREGLLESI